MYGNQRNPLLIISFYLVYQRQFVSVNGHSSSIEEINSGIPQRSILERLHFIIDINDIVGIDKKHLIIYANDKTLLVCDTHVGRLTNKPKI